MAVSSERDVVAMPSLKTDGTPDQTKGFKVLDEDGEAKAASSWTEFRESTQETVLPPKEAEEPTPQPSEAAQQ